MASIEKRITQDQEVSYRVKVRLKGFPTQTATFNRLTDAKKWAQQTEASVREGRYFKNTAARKHTLAEAIDRYCRDVLPTKPRSIKDQGGQLRWWKKSVGHYSLAEVTPSIIAEYRDLLAKGTTAKLLPRSASTVNRYLAVLSHLFTIAVKEWGWLEDNPMRKVRKPKEPRGRVRFLTDVERSKLLSACKESENSYLHLVVILCLSTGARRMEILSLQWQDVDFSRQVITLHQTKNGERRLLPIASLALTLLKQHQQNNIISHSGNGWVFPSHDGKKPMDIRTPWETALKKAEIADFRFHDLRHSAASYLAMNGASMAEIAEVLGHKTLQMVKRYAHLSEAHTASVISKMNEKIFGNAI